MIVFIESLRLRIFVCIGLMGFLICLVEIVILSGVWKDGKIGK